MDEDEIQAQFNKLATDAGRELAFNLVVSTILEEVCEELSKQGKAYERFSSMAVALGKIRNELIVAVV